MYSVFIDKILLPVTPEEITTKINGNNKTIQLINEGEINIPKSAKLTDIEFTALLPNVRGYPFARYQFTSFTTANYYLDLFERLKRDKLPFQFIISRNKMDGRRLYYTDIKVTLENYVIEESHDNGLDLSVKIKLKQYRDFGTKFVKLKENKKSGSSKKSRPSSTTKSEKPISIGSEVIVNGQLFGSSYGDAPGMTLSNYRGKISLVNESGSHAYHVTTPDGGWLGWVLKSSVKAV